ncbi:MAG: cyclic nucleotide-binding domain-containing protein [Tildeniella nuda ZEHNDER 1965/U140]|jgi:CRP-like cAMP-binding protein|nr:cyclic nucleotide-binding domain-containing protein [Tildeniella nuda ZEHNDER 1965/U140]
MAMEKLRLLLGELNQGDLDWLSKAGHSLDVVAGNVLAQADQPLHEIYFVLDGLLATVVASPNGDREVSRFKAGEGVGFLTFVDPSPVTNAIIAIAPSQLLVVPHAKLKTKLNQDSSFATRFYQTISVFLSNQLRGISTLLVRSQAAAEPPLRKVLLVFGELYDSDLDWMVKVGVPQRLSMGTLLIQEGTALDAIYILLEGTLAVFVSAIVDGRQVSKEVARLATGEILGEMSFIEAQTASATVKAVESSLVLSLPRLQLVAKLQQDARFAARFYRAIAVVLANRLKDRLTQHGYGKQTYNKDQPLDQELEYEDELDTNTLEHVSLAGVRFDWLLRRVRGSL